MKLGLSVAESFVAHNIALMWLGAFIAWVLIAWAAIAFMAHVTDIRDRKDREAHERPLR